MENCPGYEAERLIYKKNKIKKEKREENLFDKLKGFYC